MKRLSFNQILTGVFAAAVFLCVLPDVMGDTTPRRLFGKPATTTPSAAAPAEKAAKEPGPVKGFFTKVGKKLKPDPKPAAQEIPLPSETARAGSNAVVREEVVPQNANTPEGEFFDYNSETPPPPADVILEDAPQTAPRNEEAGFVTISDAKKEEILELPPLEPEVQNETEFELTIEPEPELEPEPVSEPHRTAEVRISELPPIPEEMRASVTPEEVLPVQKEVPALEFPQEETFAPSMNNSPFRLAVPRENVLKTSESEAKSEESETTDDSEIFSPVRVAKNAEISRPYGSEVRAPGEFLVDETPAGALSIRTIGPQSVMVDIPAEYQIIARNTEGTISRETQVVIRVPEWMEVVGSTVVAGTLELLDDVRGEGRKCVWNLGDLMGKTTETCVLKMVPRKSASADLQITWTNSGQTTQRKIVAETPALSAAILVKSTILEAVPTEVDVVLRNEGDCVAKNVRLTATCENMRENRISVPEVGSLLPEEERVVTLKFTPAREGDLNLRVSAALGEQSLAEAQRRFTVAAPVLRVAAEPSNRLYVGAEGVLRLRVENRGSADAHDVKLTMRAPLSMKYVSCEGDGQENLAAAAETAWIFDRIAVGESKQLLVHVRPEQNGRFDVPFLANVNGEDTEALAPCDVLAIARANLNLKVPQTGLTASVDTPFEVALSNTGSMPIRDGKLFVFFSENLEAQSANVSPEVMESGVILFPISSLIPGETKVFRVNARPSQTGVHTVRCQFQSAETQLDLLQQQSVICN